MFLEGCAHNVSVQATGRGGEPEILHGRMIAPNAPIARQLLEHVAALARSIPQVGADVAESAMRTAVHLIIAALSRQARLGGGAQAAIRAAMLGEIRRHIQAHLYEASLTPDSVLAALKLPRRTAYRLFESEGGLGSYIVNARLRHAALDLVRFPNMSITDLAYGLGFGGPSDFSRAFRRAYLMLPRDFRVMCLMET